MFLHERRQHTVGQGFFHSATLQFGKAEFAYVYDCGSEDLESLSREVNAYCDGRVHRSEIDALFISHLDSDHVNGLDRLLAHTKARIAIAPYLDSFERLMIVADAIDTGVVSGTLIQFVSDPVRWLSDRGIEIVIFIAGDEEEEGPGIVFPEPGPWPEVDRNSEAKHPIDLDWRWIKAKIPPSERVSIVSTSNGKEAEHFVIPHRAPLPIVANGRSVANWTFLTFVHPEGDRVRQFRKLIRREFGKIPLENRRWTKTCNQWLLSTLQNTTERKKLADCYSVIRRNRNLTSMSLYSGPILKTDARDWLVTRVWEDAYVDLEWRRYSGRSRHWTHHTNQCAWIGTGDANLKVTKRRRAFLNHFASLKDLVSTVTVPHHGSRNNLDGELIDQLGGLYIASAGAKSKYGHPHPEVCAMLELKGHGLIRTTEDPRSLFVERVEYARQA